MHRKRHETTKAKLRVSALPSFGAGVLENMHSFCNGHINICLLLLRSDHSFVLRKLLIIFSDALTLQQQYQQPSFCLHIYKAREYAGREFAK